ncbi:hypothetical protein [Halomonas sp. SCS19]|uniref:hypothetical protein n=1 Tax=Halomonas sp. SCS19 TaxID=2950870 RepID=UPI0032DEA080
MTEHRDGPSANAGRPKLTELEKLRRRALREELRYRELRERLREEGPDPIGVSHGPGRPPKPIQEKVYDALIKLRNTLRAVRSLEKKEGEPHKSLSEIRDPLVENKTYKAVGRKAATRLTSNDAEIFRTLTTFENILDEIDTQKTIFPPKPKLGRTPKNRLERLTYQYEKLVEQIDFMVREESRMTYAETLERQVKFLFDERRECKRNFRFEKSLRMMDYYECRISDIESLIDNYKHIIMKEKESGGREFLNMGKKKHKIARPFDRRLEMAHNSYRRIINEYSS